MPSRSDIEELLKASPAVYKKIEEEFTGKGRILTRLLRYERRGGQLEMAVAVAEALDAEKNLMVEAGTGIGKSFAYLVPLIYWSMKNGKKAVISTGTKVLQNQLVAKDLPFLGNHSDVPFKFEILYGQENFFCRRRAGMMAQQGLFDEASEASELQQIADWAADSSGVFEDYPEHISPSLKSKVCRRADACRRRDCVHYAECAYYRKRRAAERADIIVVNHHLFMAHLQSGGKLLPEFGAAVFDEAHRLEGVAADYLGLRVTNIGLGMLISRIYNPRRNSGLLPRVPDFGKVKSKARALVNQARRASDAFFSDIAGLLKPYEHKLRIREPACVPNNLEGPLDDLAGFCQEIAQDLDDEDLSYELASQAGRVAEQKGGVISFLETADSNQVYWIAAPQDSERVSIHSALVDVSEVMRNSIWSQDWVNVLTSATLTVGKSFEFIGDRIGFSGRSMWLGSPFNYQDNALTYVAHDLVSPKHPEWEGRMTARVGELINASQGRALVLFTSYATLNYCVEGLEDALTKDHTVLVQGREPRNLLLDEFRFDTSSVLFATTSFWEGVDIPGESLVLVIITRLPFEVPDDPRAEAILETYRKEGREPFTEYQLPLSVLRFRQGIGRLIRRDDDYGVIAVLDSRIVKKSYGRLFIDSMPPAPLVFNLLEVQRFFENH